MAAHVMGCMTRRSSSPENHGQWAASLPEVAPDRDISFKTLHYTNILDRAVRN